MRLVVAMQKNFVVMCFVAHLFIWLYMMSSDTSIQPFGRVFSAR